jgi:hypothetical protein
VAIGVSARVTSVGVDVPGVADDVGSVGVAEGVRVVVFPLPRPLKAMMPAMSSTTNTPAAMSRERFVTWSPG